MDLLLLRQLQRLASRGGRKPILDSVTGLGASIMKKGACTGPLFRFNNRSAEFRNAGSLHSRSERQLLGFSPSEEQDELLLRRPFLPPWRALPSQEGNSVCAFSIPARWFSWFLTGNLQAKTGNRKGERPVGAPAARAWGMEGNNNPKRLGPSGGLTALARGKPALRR